MGITPEELTLNGGSPSLGGGRRAWAGGTPGGRGLRRGTWSQAPTVSLISGLHTAVGGHRRYRGLLGGVDDGDLPLRLLHVHDAERHRGERPEEDADGAAKRAASSNAVNQSSIAHTTPYWCLHCV